MAKTLLLLLVSASLVMLSCNKEEENLAGDIRLKKVNFSYEYPASRVSGYRLFNYDAQGRIATIERLTVNEDLSNNTRQESRALTQLEYNANGQLQKTTHVVNNKPLFYFTYYYNNSGQIVKMLHTLFEPGPAVQDRAFAYDAQGRLVADTGYASPSYAFYYNTYSYNAAGNIVTYGGGRRIAEGGDVIPYEEGFSKYDDKQNPFSLLDPSYHVLFELISGSLFNRNNPVESRRVNSTSVYTYQNVYLPNGWLQGYTRQSAAGQVERELFEYEQVE